MLDRPHYPFFIAIFTLIFAFHSSVPAQDLPKPSDLITFEDPQSVKISADGNEVIVKTRKANIDKNSYEQTFWKFSTNNKTSSLKLDLPKDANSIKWFPEDKKIAYLSRAEQRNQIWVKEVGSDSANQLTEERGGIRDFSLSPDGNFMAYTTVEVNSLEQTHKKSPKKPQQGKEIDLLTFSAHQLNNKQPSGPNRSSFQLQILDLGTGEVHQITDSVSVQQFAWSPAKDKIAFTAIKSSMQPTGVPTRASSLFIYDKAANQTEVVKEGNQDKHTLYDDVISYSKPFWAPSGDKLGYMRTDYSDRWSSVSEIEIYDLQSRSSELFISAENQEFENPNFFWLEDDNIFVEFTNEANRGLFRVSKKDMNLTPVKVSARANTNFSFSLDKNTIAWASSSVGQFPEIFSSDKSFEDSQQISYLNSNNLWLPEAQSIKWTSKDGTEVQGWYIAPKNKSKDAPVITLLHGGPGIPVVNTFQPYMKQWPYPIQTLAAKGYGIFIPNYRGTHSFGKSFQKPNKPDQEPIDDVITGINHLVKKGLADKNQLGIVGHSHGGWLGPMVADEKPIFKAASFAEGFGNYLSMYGHLNGARNKELHEYQIDTTPYENPDRYLELSPAFKNDLTTQIPTLLEFGERSPVAKQGVEFAKAFWRHDTPHKLIIYPNEGHNIRSPKMKIDAMKRNIGWFEEWLPVD